MLLKNKAFICIILFSIIVIIVLSRNYNYSFQCLSESWSVLIHSKINIARIIHQSWKNKSIPRDFQRYFPSWKNCFPDWEHKFWTDEDNRNLIKEHYSWFLKTYDSFPKEIYRADVSRYFYLYHYGGIYTDLDNECLAPFEHLLKDYKFVFGTIDNVNRKTPLPENYVQNSFMYSQPRQNFWLVLIRNLINKIYYFYPTPDVLTGPELLCKMIHEYRKTCSYSHGVKIYDAWYFNPVSWGGKIKYEFCRPLGEMTDDEWRNCRQEFSDKGSYVIQYHAHTWE